MAAEIVVRALAFFDGGHLLVATRRPRAAGLSDRELREEVGRFEARLGGLRVTYVVVRVEGRAVYRRAPGVASLGSYEPDAFLKLS